MGLRHEDHPPQSTRILRALGRFPATSSRNRMRHHFELRIKAVIVIHVLQPGALGFLTDVDWQALQSLRFIQTQRRPWPLQ